MNSFETDRDREPLVLALSDVSKYPTAGRLKLGLPTKRLHQFFLEHYPDLAQMRHYLSFCAAVKTWAGRHYRDLNWGADYSVSVGSGVAGGWPLILFRFDESLQKTPEIVDFPFPVED